MRRLFSIILIFVLGFALLPCFGQKSNKPQVWHSGGEPLMESDNNFSTGRKRSGFSGGLFRKKKSNANSSKKANGIPKAKKKKRKAFVKKKYTGKKGILGWITGKKSSGWGGSAFKKNGKEDKRLFKTPKNKSRDRKRKLLRKRR